MSGTSAIATTSNASSNVSHELDVCAVRKSTALRVGPVMLPGFDGHVEPSHSGEFSAQLVGYVPGQLFGLQLACELVQMAYDDPYDADDS